MRIVTTVAPAELPVSLAEAREALGVTWDDDDARIRRYIDAATTNVEGIAGRVGVSRTVRVEYDGWPASVWALPCPPVSAVSAIEYVGLDELPATLSTDVYAVRTGGDAPATIALRTGQSWPSVALLPGCVRVTMTAGYGAAAAVPEPFKNAVIEAVIHLFERRGNAGDPELRASIVRTLGALYRPRFVS